MSFRLGIDDYILSYNPVQRKSGKCKDIPSIEIYRLKKYIEGEKDR